MSRSEAACAWTDESSLYAIIRGEYSEMPGLALTARQGARLWNVEHDVCAQVLDRLVHSGFLVKVHDIYARAGSGRRCL